MACLADGMDIRATAKALNRSERTVKAHTTGILGRLCLESRLQAGIVAHQLAEAGRLPLPADGS
jgi:DNA-binding NarL/FixJ family response regulator